MVTSSRGGACGHIRPRVVNAYIFVSCYKCAGNSVFILLNLLELSIACFVLCAGIFLTRI